MSQSPYATPEPLWERVLGPVLDFVLFTIPAWLEKKSTPPVVSKADQERMVQAAIDFWANPLEQGSMSGIGSVSEGMDGMGAGLLFLAASKTPTRHSQTGIAKFRQNLHGLITNMGQPRDVMLSTDYGPEDRLITALEGTGLEVGCAFPMKTTVIIDYEQGEVRTSQVRGDSKVLCKVPVSEEALAARLARRQRH